MEKIMKAVMIDKPTKGEDVVLSKTAVPEEKPRWVVVKVKAFGMNHSEEILREFEIQNDYIQKPIIPGIECVGEIVNASDSGWKVGQKVVALMGGMGRSFNGSYAEYALLPIHHVFPIESELLWMDMAAIPETYFTAWGSLFQCLRLTKEDKLLVRGATCALGYVAIQLAKALGCTVVGTTHREGKMQLLKDAGCDECILDDGSLCGKVSGITKALELIGIKTLKDTMMIIEQGGMVCNTGVLGKVYEWNHFDPIKDIPNGICLTGFYSNDPTKSVMQDIFCFMDEHQLKPLIGATYRFEDIREACIALDSGKVNGKIVVSVDES
ncbi:alcohol dehydrogenase catalytic domain-containing protein [Oribacterium parvum]|jgi:NADPH:quinone reductase and related Zn-dependent oxidoreductases|uniref:alcohol dehydrogenase catalytic domain-containing protein n=1 Tax=Oribacterium parvum TaxID=1501329 RepID=UPI002352671F|nr:zinc-binding dehydrogenase [Oribacterium parvum]